VPFIVVVGDKEMASASVAVRARGNQDLGVMALPAFLDHVQKALSSKA